MVVVVVELNKDTYSQDVQKSHNSGPRVRKINAYKGKTPNKNTLFYTGNYEETLPNIHPEEIYHLQMNEWIRELNQTGKTKYRNEKYMFKSD